MRKGILFDKDGTLFEFGPIWLQATIEFLAAITVRTDQKIGVVEALGMVDGELVSDSALTSGTPADVATILVDHQVFTTTGQAEQFVKDFFYEFLVAHLDNVKPVGDLIGLLQRLKAQGYVLGIATSDEINSTMATLKYAQVKDLFDFIATADEYPTKPNPAALMAFCEQCQLALTDVIVVGDSRMDIELGNLARAGVAVLSGTSTADNFTDLTPYIYADIQVIPYQQILPTLNKG
ncbi:HAD family hydrolase [Periweissella ghanensis]|uniref:Phosphoglycolate phosphatase n=1 Tax=Periweissella ghanensis TaxID=467997 RepID=A0ABM8ZAV9_9LACO|nr:HAD family hydrolase [Periweissella ghanensis]MCM0600588.1 HAD family hydrolase [Periweissella ghanensis]CAH0418329.1 Phosphoglycolate phosphatase [Periweissella ghanensis]